MAENIKSILKYQSEGWSPFSKSDKDDLVKKRALQGYNTDGFTYLGMDKPMREKASQIDKNAKLQFYKDKISSNSRERPQVNIPAASNIGLKNVHPEFALLAAPAGVGLTAGKNILGTAVYGAGQGAVWNASGLASDQNPQGLITDILGGGIAAPVMKVIGSKINNLIKFNPEKFDLSVYERLFTPTEELKPNLYHKFKAKQIDFKFKKPSLSLEERGKLAAEVNNYWSDVRKSYTKKALKTLDTGNVKSGAFGSVYPLKKDPNYLVKIGTLSPGEDPVKLAQLGKTLNIQNAAIPIKAVKFSATDPTGANYFASLMKKAPGNSLAKYVLEGNPVPREALAEAAKTIRLLHKNNIGFDYVGDNILYDAASKKVSLIDLGVFPDLVNNYSGRAAGFLEHIYKKGQNPASVLKEKFLKYPNASKTLHNTNVPRTPYSTDIPQKSLELSWRDLVNSKFVMQGRLGPNSQISSWKDGGTIDKNPINLSSQSLEISKANKHIPWIDRGLNPWKYPTVNNSDGTFSTHRMAAETDGKDWYVFPTLDYKDGEWKSFPNNWDAFDYHKKNNTLLKVPNKELALFYAKNGLIPHQKYQLEGGLVKKIKATINPKNWGVPDYSYKGSRAAAYAAARKAGEKEFMWNNKRFNTNYAGTAQQQLKETGITNKQRLSNNFIRDRIENNLYDFEYNDIHQGNKGSILFPLKKMKKIVINNEKESDFLNVIGEIPENLKTHKDLLSLYLGKPQKYNTVNISKYIPSDSKEINKEYFSINDEEFQNYILEHLDEDYISEGLNSGEIQQAKDKKGNIIPNRYIISDIGTGLGEFTVSKGKDIKGEYISYWDKWNLNPYKGRYSAADISNIDDFGIGKPFDIYDRIYYRENPNANKYTEYDEKIKDLWNVAIKTQDKKYADEIHKLYPIRNSYYNRQNKYIKQYYSDKELSELDVNKKNFDTLALQKELSNRGYELPKSTKKFGTFDGILGEETKSALLDYQNKTKIKE